MMDVDNFVKQYNELKARVERTCLLIGEITGDEGLSWNNEMEFTRSNPVWVHTGLEAYRYGDTDRVSVSFPLEWAFLEKSEQRGIFTWLHSEMLRIAKEVAEHAKREEAEKFARQKEVYERNELRRLLGKYGLPNAAEE